MSEDPQLYARLEQPFMQRKHDVYVALEPRLSAQGQRFSQAVRRQLKTELVRLMNEEPAPSQRELEQSWVAAHVPVWIDCGWLELGRLDQLRLVIPGAWDGLRLAPLAVLGLGLRTLTPRLGSSPQ